MHTVTLSDDSDMLSVFMFSLVRNQRAELDGSGWAVGTQRQRVLSADGAGGSQSWQGGSTLSTVFTSCSFSHTRQRLMGHTGWRLFAFPSSFSSDSQCYHNQMGIGFPCWMRGTARPIAPRSPQSPQMQPIHRSSAGRSGTEGRGAQFWPFQQLGCRRVPRVFPRKEVRAGRPPVPGGPTSAQPPALRSFPYKAVVVAEEIDRKKKAIKSCVSVTCPALQEPGTSPPRAPR